MTSGATDLINEAATSKITGEEERYSNTDLPVFAANVEAAMEVVSLLQPYLLQQDFALLTQIMQRAAAVDDALRSTRPAPATTTPATSTTPRWRSPSVASFPRWSTPSPSPCPSSPSR
jgi:iron uptake system component EfeO